MESESGKNPSRRHKFTDVAFSQCELVLNDEYRIMSGATICTSVSKSRCLSTLVHYKVGKLEGLDKNSQMTAP